MSEPRLHLLKCWPESFRALSIGVKRHEVRRDDRAFMVGDVLRIDEWEPHAPPSFWDGEHRDVFQARKGCYTGRRQWFRVTYKSAGGTWGLPADICVLSVEPCDPLPEAK